jgi:hypothetical protein
MDTVQSANQPDVRSELLKSKKSRMPSRGANGESVQAASTNVPSETPKRLTIAERFGKADGAEGGDTTANAKVFVSLQKQFTLIIDQDADGFSIHPDGIEYIRFKDRSYSTTNEWEIQYMSNHRANSVLFWNDEHPKEIKEKIQRNLKALKPSLDELVVEGA